MRLISGVGAVCVVLSGQVNAADYCSTPAGSPLIPKTFDQVILDLPKPTAAKSEFESTADYQARISAAATGARQVLMLKPIGMACFADPVPLEYDADQQALKVRATAFDWGTTDWFIQLRVGNPKGLDADVTDNVATVINRATKKLGTYRASNAFGASEVVTRETRSTDSVWVRRGNDKKDRMFRGDDGAVLGTIPMLPSEAKLTKPKIRFALVLTPKTPFLVTGTGLGSSPTLDDPYQIPESQDFFRVLIANVDCGIVLDGSNKVLVVYPAAN